MKTALAKLSLASVLSACISVSAVAADKWWPVKVYDASTPENKEVDYEPVEKASKPYNFCTLIPHLKDGAWVSMTYGLVQEAKRTGVNMTIFEAGGYENLPRQISQFDDCIASKPDIILVAPISEAGLTQKLTEAKEKGIPVVVFVNPVTAPDLVPAKVYADYQDVGEMAGKFAAKYAAGKELKAVLFPGPAGGGWSEDTGIGFRKGVEGSAIKVIDEKFGDTGVAVQLQLVQDALQSYPDLNLIYGTGPTTEAAVGAIAEAGRTGEVQIICSFVNSAIIDMIKSGEVLAAGTEFQALETRIAIDQAVRILDKKPYISFVKTLPTVISKENIDKIDMDLVVAPVGWKPVFTVKAE
jgi:protein TorT